MSSAAAKIRYLASCHEADNRESGIFDLFHRDVKHRHFATGTEVLVSGIQDALDLERYRMLRRAGLSVFPLSFASWTRTSPLVLRPSSGHRLVALGSMT